MKRFSLSCLLLACVVPFLLLANLVAVDCLKVDASSSEKTVRQEAMDNLKISTYKKKSQQKGPRSKSGMYPIPSETNAQFEEQIKQANIGITREEIRRSLKSFGQHHVRATTLGARR